jgi:hypothetical protein
MIPGPNILTCKEFQRQKTDLIERGQATSRSCVGTRGHGRSLPGGLEAARDAARRMDPLSAPAKEERL